MSLFSFSSWIPGAGGIRYVDEAKNYARFISKDKFLRAILTLTVLTWLHQETVWMCGPDIINPLLFYLLLRSEGWNGVHTVVSHTRNSASTCSRYSIPRFSMVTELEIAKQDRTKPLCGMTFLTRAHNRTEPRLKSTLLYTEYIVLWYGISEFI